MTKIQNNDRVDMTNLRTIDQAELTKIEGGFLDPFSAAALTGLAIGGAIVSGVIIYKLVK